LERVPFDIPEAETEIVAGPWTELTGRRLALMQLAMNITLVTGSALVAAVFLGGPMTPWTITPAWLSGVVGFLLFLVKTLAILLILVSITVASGRIRIDQLNDIGWKYLATAALLQMGVVLMMNYLWVGG
jgi:NADH-quinone oxidoreductase subunit H